MFQYYRESRMRFGNVFLLVTGLVVSSCRDADSEAFFHARLPAPFSIDMLTVTVTDGSTVRTLTTPDFERMSSVQFDGRMIPIASSGRAHISVVLRASGDVVSSGSLEVALRADRLWAFTIQPDTADPRRYSMGPPTTLVVFPIAMSHRTVQADSLYVYWSATSRSERGTVIY
jgi:hypothetical protein